MPGLSGLAGLSGVNAVFDGGGSGISYYYATITVDNTKVLTTETDFPVLISGTYDGTAGKPDLRTVANGGKINNTANGGVSGSYTVPADFILSPNADGSSKYSFEIQEYNAVTGKIIAWVKIPSLSHTVDTVFYMTYGMSGLVASQEDINNTWNSDFVAVWHLVEQGDGTAGEYLDSTANSNNGQGGEGNGALTPTRVAGKIGYGQQFDGVGDFISVPDSATLDDDAAGPFTVETWMEPVDFGGPYAGIVWKNGMGGAYRYGTALNRKSSTKYVLAAFGGGWVEATTQQDMGAFIHAAYRQTTGNIYLYENASADGSGGYNPANTTLALHIGNWVATYPYEGILDELRISKISRSDGYLTATYNNAVDPSSFYAVGNESSA